MKKTLLIVMMFMLAIISIQNVIFADMDAPGIEPYEAHISNVNGAEYFDYTGNVVGKLNYGDVITVRYEFKDSNTNELTADFKLPDDTEYTMYTIKMKDIKPIEGKVENLEITEKNKNELIILKEGGIELSKGPAYVYEKTGVIIPKGTKIDGYRSKDENSGLPWYYITYNGTTGWICELDGAIGKEKEYKDLELLTPRTTNIYKNPNYTQSVTQIPANVLITDLLQIDPWSQGYYVTYEGKSGYLSMGDCASNFPWLDGDKTYEYEVNYPEVKLYKEASTKSEVLIDHIPEGEILKYSYSDDVRAVGWLYTTYKNINGWVFYVEEGFDYRDYLYYQDSENNFEEELLDNENVIEEIENKVEENLDTNENVTEVSKENASTITSATQMVILCAMWGLTIFVTSIVTIALVNRKKKE